MSKKLGIEKPKSAHVRGREETKEHKHVPGRAYDVTDPTQKLISMIGGGFFNEPRYYDTNRSYVDFLTELRKKGCIRKTITDQMGLSEQAREVIEAMHAVAESDNPEDLLIIAAWARDKKKGLKLRYTPQIALVLASANDKTKPHVPRYATSIMQRADEIRQVFAAFRHLFHVKEQGLYKGGLPRCLKKALNLALATESAYGLIKYNGEDRPTFGDVLKMVGGDAKMGRWLASQTGKTRQHWPVSKGLYDYLVNGEVTENAPDIVKARTEFFKLKNVSDVTKELLDRAGLTWENIVSHFGSSKEVWELAIPYMAEMALVRNLRNFEQAEISKKSWDYVYEKTGSIVDTHQLPFRFFSAEREVTSTDAKSVTDRMLDNACKNLPDLPGVTVLMTDNSGSAVGCAISGKSKLRVSDAGNILEAVAAKKYGRNAMIGVFGDSFIWVPFSESDSCMAIKHRIDSKAQNEERSKNGALAISSGYRRGRGVGGGTETGLWCGIHDLTERGIKVDRIIILSDFCCYTQGDAHNCGNNMRTYFGKDGCSATIQSMLDVYRRKVNPDLWVHSIDLQGYGQAQLRPGTKRTQLLSGWSEQVFGLIRNAEFGDEQTQQQNRQSGEKVEVPTIDLLRERYAQ